MRILMPSIVNPAIERNGAATVTRGLLKLLSSPPLNARVDCVPARIRPPQWRRFHQARSLFLSTVSSLPAKAAYLHSPDFRQRVTARVASGEYDLAILNGADLLWISECIPPSVPRILVAHNIEHLLYRTQIDQFGALGRLLDKDCERLREYELGGMREAGRVIFLSTDEAAYARSRCDNFRSLVLPPVFDYEPPPRAPRTAGPTLEIGLLGNWNWWPNQLGLHWFANEILPFVKSPVRLHLFGEHSARTRDPRIIPHGPVPDVSHVWKTCDFVICPVFASGGVCVKLAEALYNGVPVLATSHAARGLPLGEDPALILLDQPAAWASFLNSSCARELAARQVRPTTAAVFDLHAHCERVHQFLQ